MFELVPDGCHVSKGLDSITCMFELVPDGCHVSKGLDSITCMFELVPDGCHVNKGLDSITCMFELVPDGCHVNKGLDSHACLNWYLMAVNCCTGIPQSPLQDIMSARADSLVKGEFLSFSPPLFRIHVQHTQPSFAFFPLQQRIQ